MQLPDFQKYIIINGQMRVLTRDFFWTNLYWLKNCSCKKCGKGNLGKFDRVDCEFWPGKDGIESYCLNCWAKS